MPITIQSKGNWKTTLRFLEKVGAIDFHNILNKYGKKGVDALAEATPKDTGKTAASWIYDVDIYSNGASITWSNTNVVNGWFNVAIMLQYGHGTRNGAWVEGIDYINPAIQPIFEEMADKVWEEITT